jgi:RNA polymerase sigma-B factor
MPTSAGERPEDVHHRVDEPARPVMDDADFPGNDPETWTMFVRYRRDRDRALRNALIERHMVLAEGLARPYARRGEPFDDLRQVAMLGLLKAVDRFDPHREIPFASFAIPTIRGELRRHFRDHGWTIKVPRRLQELHLELDAIAGKVAQELGRPATVSEIARAAGVSDEDVLEAMEVSDLYRPHSLDAPARGDGAGGAVAESLGREDHALDDAETRLALRTMLQQLSERDRRIVYLRYFEEMTQSEIAEQVGISQMHVSRLLARSLEVLAAALDR